MNLAGPGRQNRVAPEALTEEVAAGRRELPPGGPVPRDYVFDTADGPLPMSALFGPHDTLVVYSMMFPAGAADRGPCPLCTSFLDAFDGAARHVAQRVAVAVSAKAPITDVLAHGRRRGWQHLRLVSAAGTTVHHDHLAETHDGAQQLPMLNVFHRDGTTLRHFWGSELLFAEPVHGQDPRHADTFDLRCNLLDLCPAGRGADRYPSLQY